MPHVLRFCISRGVPARFAETRQLRWSHTNSPALLLALALVLAAATSAPGYPDYILRRWSVLLPARDTFRGPGKRRGTSPTLNRGRRSLGPYGRAGCTAGHPHPLGQETPGHVRERRGGGTRQVCEPFGTCCGLQLSVPCLHLNKRCWVAPLFGPLELLRCLDRGCCGCRRKIPHCCLRYRFKSKLNRLAARPYHRRAFRC